MPIATDLNFKGSIDIFQKIREHCNMPGFAWLDSTLTVSDKGKRSLLAVNPVGSVIMHQTEPVIKGLETNSVALNECNITSLVESFVKKNNLTAIGFISYEAMLENVGIKSSKRTNDIPLAGFYFYDTVEWFNDSSIRNSEFNFENDSNVSKADLISWISKDEYLRKIQKVKEHIREGDIYQANFTTRFEVETVKEPIDVFLKLRKINPTPYGAFLNFDDFQIISSSPERMFTLNGVKIQSDPIKGTIGIGASETEMKQNLEKLLSSDKDKAELLMIVDLVRNDLGKIAKTGTVKVDELFKTEIYSSLIHLVSSVSAELKENVSLTDICQALMPGGSITGTPKKRAVELLNEMEQFPRSVYTGCVGIIAPEYADFNIAIRTMTCKNSRWHIHAGGGIVADSEPEMEYDEMLLKTKNMFIALGIDLNELQNR